MAIRIGCGSWSDDAYAGVLYPPKLAKNRRLEEYGRWFDHVEINSSYYTVPRQSVIENWVRQTPDNFVFDFKLHRHLLSRLTKAEKSSGDMAEQAESPPQRDIFAYTLEQVQPLLEKKKLGTFLLLLSPHFRPEKKQLRELDSLLERIKPHLLAVELRHRAWVDGKNKASTLAYFRERGLVWVAVDMPRLKDDHILPPIDEVTQPKLAYLRLHGRNKNYLKCKTAEERHDYLYNPRELREIVKRIQALASQAENVHVVANNHARDFAPRTALALKRLLGEKLRKVDWQNK